MCMSACAFETFCGGAAGPQKRTIFDVCIAALARAAPLASRPFSCRVLIFWDPGPPAACGAETLSIHMSTDLSTEQPRV